VLASGGHTPITQVPDHLEHFAPGREGAFVDTLVIINGQNELEELV
jgi:hypothetical protein